MTDIPAPTHLGTIYTAKEAAARLKMTQRGVITLGKRYGCCSVHGGRTVLFSEQDLVDIWQIMRAPATESKLATARALSSYSTDVFFRDLLRKEQAKKDERRRFRKAQEAETREKRLEEKRQATRAKLDARIAKREAKAQEMAARRAARSVPASELDLKNRDPAYWTDERKKALRRERAARIQEHVGEDR
ncbi:hypothetical protein EN851_03365 [Mesorhizobium sp. M8A.F.Ca.ET.208.01.1.1]|uniref:hypothetical protein n=1 Tax=unclassified Mesorhizobium TaxID=325217 RepID=UPI0010940F5E|nr:MULTISPECIES: hypothetical protein [unclassified Mesorhizobium]TGQ94608.1 hypothetical protein EN851_03365 [Mesorhizobium sp. M8A.F.Ca.ET.208.01.1.1]TGT55096.1 hypothetical protein EN810_03365 [Mesorhizobium sp. M8A.F.Ca.ET.167.01.1.1]